ncbi:hypothetical protein QPK87_09770 [Kamptonema cortianum]|nr:hypothetical protein [Geitlerinema splendidum]MDK3156862.1 hypothetical protein [Kamptonema cortianum]
MGDKKKKLIIAACLVFVVAIVGYRFFTRPWTPDQVGYGALGCMERGDLVCLMKFAPKVEAEFHQAKDKGSLRRLGNEIVQLRGGSLRPTGEVSKEILDSQFSYSREYENSDGKIIVYSVTVQQSDNGFRGAYLLDDYIFSHINMRVKDEPPLPGGLRKMERLAKFATYGEEKLSPLGYKGATQYGDDGSLKLKPWQDFRDTFESRKHLLKD